MVRLFEGEQNALVPTLGIYPYKNYGYTNDDSQKRVGSFEILENPLLFILHCYSQVFCGIRRQPYRYCAVFVALNARVG